MLMGDDLGPDLPGIAVRNPIELGHQIRGPDIRRGIAVALEAHGHIERLLLMDFDHLVYAAVAAYAAHPAARCAE